MTSREQFEAWAEEVGALPWGYLKKQRTQNGGYSVQIYNYMWSAWQASREAVEIEIPENKLLSNSILKPNVVYGLKRNEVVERIRAAGIKVKGE